MIWLARVLLSVMTIFSSETLSGQVLNLLQGICEAMYRSLGSEDFSVSSDEDNSVWSLDIVSRYEWLERTDDVLELWKHAQRSPAHLVVGIFKCNSSN